MPETDLQTPVETIATDDVRQPPEEGIAVCLSGGGYRAMLFHTGSLWRLHQAGLLQQAKRISSVSGGSITAGILGLEWQALRDGARFEDTVVRRVRMLANRTIDQGSILGGALLPGSIGEQVVRSYKKHVFGEATLQDLPDEPRFVINASNVQSGALWRFSKPFMRDYRVGQVKHPTISLAFAVAASSAFPPFLSPARLELDEEQYAAPEPGEDLHHPPFTTNVILTDGGVYDNLGLETAWKRYDTILVSDAGGKMGSDPEPKTDWARHSLRVLDLVDNQVRSLRKRQVISSFEAKKRKGTYWGIRTNIAHYEHPDVLPCPHDRTMLLAMTKTRLARLGPEAQERLINWGYAVTDAALRAHVDKSIPKGAFPYAGGVG